MSLILRFPFRTRGRRRRRGGTGPGRPVYGLAGLAVLAAGAFAWTGAPPSLEADASDTFTCTVAGITDGDTFRCAEQGADGRQVRIRLSGVAARERDGSCSEGHPCPSASAEAATAELRELATSQVLTCRNVGSTYGRIAAFCRRADGIDLSCAMVESGTALRWDRHWGSHRCH